MSDTALAIDYEDESYEIIGGETIMRAAAAIPHIRIQGYLFNILYNFLKGKKCEVFSEARVDFDDENSFVPDLLVVCDKNKIKETHIEGAPDFIVEVLSLSTQERDYTIKKNIYEKYGVKEYWIIDPVAKNIIVHLWKNGKYRVAGVYHGFSEKEWNEYLTDTERARQKLSLKISLYDDLEIKVNEIFESR
ncbi:MAG: Uma2 family endonuclease [Selenomonadaceae bacterium]|nr:Uma2 family endonuclease [Selenomonadaceae bacterium]